MLGVSEPTREQAARRLSRGRWASYLQAANDDHEAALALYRWNAKASASLLELLSYLEVMLRHRVDEVMAPLEVVPSARLRADAGWWFGSGTFVEDKTVEAVRRSRDHVESQVKQHGGPGSKHDRARVLDSLTFGTWTGLFGKPYEEMWRQHLKDVFPDRPRGTKRSVVSELLEELHQLRNRLTHHEAIHDLDLETAADRALDLIGWMDPAARGWVGAAVRVHEVLENRPVKPAPVAGVVAAGKAWPARRRAVLLRGGGSANGDEGDRRTGPHHPGRADPPPGGRTRQGLHAGTPLRHRRRSRACSDHTRPVAVAGARTSTHRPHDDGRLRTDLRTRSVDRGPAVSDRERQATSAHALGGVAQVDELLEGRDLDVAGGARGAATVALGHVQGCVGARGQR